MISCTEFIPAYSELFTYLEKKVDRKEVDAFWEYLFAPTGDGVPLINYIEKEGIRGCYSYWAGSLNEEAADFTMYLNEKQGWFMLKMHHCPSKGRLLKLKEDIGIAPYHDYCLHCDHYRSAVEKVGLKYLYNFEGVDHAACSIIIYDPNVFDGRIIIDDDTVIMDRKASDNEYFHRDFHSSMNMGIEYVGEKFGIEGVREYLTMYTEDVYKNVIADAKENGLAAIERKIVDTYTKEKALDALKLDRTDAKLTVTVSSCPAIAHLKNTGRTISKWYRYTTEIVMEVLAEKAGYIFHMDSYDEETGAAIYTFETK